MTNNGRAGVALYLVPGIMGSTLVDTGRSPSGVPFDEEVWSDDLSQIRRVLGSNPAALSRETLKPGRVIQRLRGLISTDVYGRVVDFSTRADGLALREGSDLFLFAYDWRKSCAVNAEALAEFIETHEKGFSRQIVILAHSMGGLISRLMLMRHPKVMAQTRKLLQVASPVAGVAKAYYTLKVRPELNPLFDALWTKAHKKRPELRAELLAAVSTFDSVYELLPPRQVTMLMHMGGAHFHATHRQAWQGHLHQRLDAAEAVHNELAGSETIIGHLLAIVYSDAFPTVNGYVVDDNFLCVRQQKPRPDGDATVPTYSALAAASKCIPVKAAKDHSSIMGCAQLQATLREVVTR